MDTQPENDSTINSGGSAYVRGDAHVGGDFIGRDKNVHNYYGTESPAEKAEREQRYDQKIARYLESVRNRTAILKLRGVPIRGADSLSIPLSNVYIQVQALEERAAKEEQRREQAEALGDFEKEDQRRERPKDLVELITRMGEYFYRKDQVMERTERPAAVDPVDAVEAHEQLSFLGAPGSGKSTLMDYLAHRFASGDGPIPLQVSLGTYARELTRDSALSLRAYALRQAAAGDDELHAALQAKIENNEVLWLLDGLDEAYERRDAVSEGAASLPGRVVLTSRPVGYSRAGRMNWKHFEILPLSTENVETFTHDWLTALAKIHDWNADRVDTCAENLKQQLAERPNLTPLTRIPLLLTFMVVLAGENSGYQLPGRRAGLYGQYLDRLFMIHEAEHLSIEEILQRAVTQSSLQFAVDIEEVAQDSLDLIAYYMHLGFHDNAELETPKPEVLITLVAQGLQVFYKFKWRASSRIAEAAVKFWYTAGLIEKQRWDKEELYTFRHLTFQEYGVARLLHKLWQRNPQQTWTFLETRLHRPAWREPILLFVSMADGPNATKFVRHLLKGPSLYERELHRDLRLAAACVGENFYIDARVSGQVAARLIRSLLNKLWYSYFIALNILGLLCFWLFKPSLIMAILFSPVWLALLWWLVVPGFIAWSRTQSLLLYPLRHFGLGRVNNLHFISALQYMNEAGIAPLIVLLGNANRDVRVGAANALGMIGDARVVEPLVNALGDSERDVRRSAVDALGKIGDVRAIEPLMNTLGDVDGEVRHKAIDVLANLGDDRVVESLITALDDTDYSVRSSAITALEKLGNERSVEPLIKILGDSEWLLPHGAATALAKIGNAALDPLITALSDADAAVRCRAADALGELGNVRALEPLNTALNDTDREVRQCAARALRKLGVAVEFEPFLFELVCDDFRRLGDPLKLESLVAALDDDNDLVRFTAIGCLRALDDARAIGPLLSVLGEEYGFTHVSAMAALEGFGDSAVQPLIIALGNEQWLVRIRAALVLENLSHVAVEPLVTALGDANELVRCSAAEILGKIGDLRAVKPLITALGDVDATVRRSAADSMGKLGSLGAVVPLIVFLRDADESVSSSAANALEKLYNDADGSSIVALLIVALNITDKKHTRRKVIKALEEVNDPNVIEPLVAILSSADGNVRRRIIKILGNLGDALAVELLIVASSYANADIRGNAVDALGKLSRRMSEEQKFRVAEALAQRVTDPWLDNIPFDNLESVVSQLNVEDKVADIVATLYEREMSRK